MRDAGRGPPEAIREQIFERFYRGADSAERPGSGLGLPIAALIARRHGGSVRVEGAEFILDLPAAVSVSAAQPLRTTVVPTAP